MTTLFAKIVSGEIPSDIVYQDDTVTAFRDINPVAPTHILVVPNKVIPTTNDITEEDEPLLGHLVRVATLVAKQEGIAEEGYRLVFNCNENGGQVVFHIHLHIVGGRKMSWPPG